MAFSFETLNLGHSKVFRVHIKNNQDPHGHVGSAELKGKHEKI